MFYTFWGGYPRMIQAHLDTPFFIAKVQGGGKNGPKMVKNQVPLFFNKTYFLPFIATFINLCENTKKPLANVLSKLTIFINYSDFSHFLTYFLPPKYHFFTSFPRCSVFGPKMIVNWPTFHQISWIFIDFHWFSLILASNHTTKLP